jgi:hypothetical protein
VSHDEAIVPSTDPTKASGTTGILPDHMISELAQRGGIRPARDFAADQIQPASLDLRLGKVAYRVRASFLPGPRTTVAERIAELKLHEIALTGGAVLETNCVYIVPLLESLALPADVAAAANPKSSTGRIDVFTRVIADNTRGFDRIASAAVRRCSTRHRFARCTARSGSPTTRRPTSPKVLRSVSISPASAPKTSSATAPSGTPA